MKKFEFRLESVLRVYEMKLELEQAKLSHLLAEEETLVRTMQETEAARRQESANFQLMSILERTDLRALSSFLLCSRAKLLRSADELMRVRRDIAEQRQIVIRAERNFRAVQKLRSRKFRDWEQANAKQFEADAQEIWLAVRHRLGDT